MFSLKYLKVLVDLIRGRETEGREMDEGGNAGGNKNVGELLAAVQTYLFMQRQFPGLLLLLQLTCSSEQHR